MRSSLSCLAFSLILTGIAGAQTEIEGEDERQDDPYLAPAFPTQFSRPYAPRGPGHGSQVNVSPQGLNIRNDAGNEPSMAIDPFAPNRIAIGWRQFDNVASNFRQGGWAFSRDGGRTWTNGGPHTPGYFRSDPVLATSPDGRFYYNSLRGTATDGDTFLSDTSGASWGPPIYSFGGDKTWITVDHTSGPGRGNMYHAWSPSSSCCPGIFTRSIDEGETYLNPVTIPNNPLWGTLAVGPTSNVYVAGTNGAFARSQDAWDPTRIPTFPLRRTLNLGGSSVSFNSSSPNPGGLCGQTWIVTDTSTGPRRGWIYVLGSVTGTSPDPLDIKLIRSTDAGNTWSAPIRVNRDPSSANSWQWFGALSISPDGRLDVTWNDTRESQQARVSRLYFTSSSDGGDTWSAEQVLSEPFNSWIGWPNQNKMGDYSHMLSDRLGTTLAYAATFNGEQDVYCIRIGPYDCNGNGVDDAADISAGTSLDCNANGIPDSCDIAAGLSADENHDGIPDECQGCAHPAIDIAPIDQGVWATDSATLTVAPSGRGPFTYSWRHNGVPVSDGPSPTGAVVSGSATGVLRIRGVHSADGGAYDVQISNSCGPTLSPAAILTVTCFADFNQDGGIDGSDVESFFRSWQAGEAEADVNRDGGTDGGDVQTFFTSWIAGGC